MEMKVNIKRCFYELWKKKKIVALFTAFSVLVGVYMMLNVEEVGNYSATASIYSVVYGSYDETMNEQSNLSEFTAIGGSKNVAKRAVEMLDREDVTEENIQYLYNISSNGNFMYVSGYAYDPDLAVSVVNAVADAFVVEYRNLTGGENIQVFEKAEQAQYYSGDSTNKKMTLVIYSFVGFFLFCVIIVVRVIFSAKVQDYTECNMDGAIEILGVIPEKEE